MFNLQHMRFGKLVVLERCRWATPLEQQHNQRRHYVLEEVCDAFPSM
jgi:hypothetical protein